MAVNRRGPFAVLLISCTISVAGTSMSAIAVPWLVLTTTGSATRTGLVAFAQMGMYVVTQMLAGPVVDRVGLRRSFVVGNTLAGVAVGAIPTMQAFGELSFPVLVALVAFAGAVRGAADTANGALVPMTAQVGGIDLERASGLYSSTRGVAQLIGAPLAGVLVAAYGSASAIAVDAVTFAAAAAAVTIWIRLPESKPAGADTEPKVSALRKYCRDLAEGARFVRGDRLLLGIIAMVAISNLLDQGFQEVMLPVWVRREIGSAAGLGVIGAAGAIAALSGNFIATWIGARIPRRTVYSWGYLIGGAPRLIVIALTTALAPVVCVVLVTEMFAGSLNPAIGATQYERIPEQLRARVLGLMRASAWAGIPFGALLGGYLVQALGLRTSVFAFAVVYLLTTLAPFVFPVWRQMRRPEPESTAPTTTDPVTA
jgi:MFS family permease